MQSADAWIDLNAFQSHHPPAPRTRVRMLWPPKLLKPHLTGSQHLLLHCGLMRANHSAWMNRELCRMT